MHGARKAESVQGQSVVWVVGGQFPVGQDGLLYYTASIPNLGPTLPSLQWVLGTPFSGVKRPEYEDDC
jgi:hypothetical protein